MIPIGKVPVAPSAQQPLADRSAKGLWAISSSERSNEKSGAAPRMLHAPLPDAATRPDRHSAHTTSPRKAFILPAPCPSQPSGGIGRSSGLKSGVSFFSVSAYFGD